MLIIDQARKQFGLWLPQNDYKLKMRELKGLCDYAENMYKRALCYIRIIDYICISYLVVLYVESED